MRIALAGNPNSGKTTMYNCLTGQNETVGNWAGVTVEKKEHPLKKSFNADSPMIIVDLPGAYSMSPFTSEENVTSDYINNESLDAIINIVDATNLSRSLFFTTQLLELGIPVVVALNKSDINEKRETDIDVGILSEKLGCPVVTTVSTSNDGLFELINEVKNVVGTHPIPPYKKNVSDENSKKAVNEDDRRRFEFVKGIVSEAEKKKIITREKNVNDKIDAVLTNKWVGIPIFAVVMFLVFSISQSWLGLWIAEGVEIFGVTVPGLVSYIDMFKEWVAGALEGGNDFLVALLCEGVIGGFSAVVGFLPLVMVMYFLIALLEDCGYMARVSVVLDPIFKKVGLSGKSVIPFVIGTGCAVPGVMACRTIRDEGERRATAMLAPLMPCGAKLPVISLFAGAFFADASYVGVLMYFAGILIIFFSALIIKAVTGAKKQSYFIIELPEYKIPSLYRAFRSMLDRGWAYIVKAGTIILLCNAAVFVMQSFDWSFSLVGEGDQSTSILASIARPISVLFIPIGIKAWQMTAAIITGFIAKENVVGTLAVCYGISNLIDVESLTMAEGAASGIVGVFGISSVAALAFLMFNLFSPPCFAAIGAMNSELKSTKWFFAAILFQLGEGYTIAYLVYTIGMLLTAPASLDVVAAICGGVAVACFAFVLVALSLKAKAKSRKA